MNIAEMYKTIKDGEDDNFFIHPHLVDGLSIVRPVKLVDKDTWLSASKVPGMCERSIIIAHRLKVEFVDSRGPEDRWLADRGTYLHSMFQDKWLGPLKMLMGGWQCPHCSHVHTSNGSSEVTFDNSVICPDKCEKCGKKNDVRWNPFKFMEPWCRNEDVMVRGPCDGLLVVPFGGLEILDLKTVKNMAGVKRAPRENHVKQLHWYMDPSGIRRGRIVYMDPGAKKFSEAFVEHLVEFDNGLVQSEKERVLALREALKEENQDKPPPACKWGGQLPYGPCECTQLESLWASHGH